MTAENDLNPFFIIPFPGRDEFLQEIHDNHAHYGKGNEKKDGSYRCKREDYESRACISFLNVCDEPQLHADAHIKEMQLALDICDLLSCFPFLHLTAQLIPSPRSHTLGEENNSGQNEYRKGKEIVTSC